MQTLNLILFKFWEVYHENLFNWSPSLLSKTDWAFSPQKRKKVGLDMEHHIIYEVVLLSGYAHHMDTFCPVWSDRDTSYRPVNPVGARGQKHVLIGLSAYRDTLGEILAVLSPQQEYFSPDRLWKCSSDPGMLMTRCDSKHQFISRWLQDCDDVTVQEWVGTCQHKSALRSPSSPAWEAFTDGIDASFKDHRLQWFKYAS